MFKAQQHTGFSQGLGRTKLEYITMHSIMTLEPNVRTVSASNVNLCDWTICTGSLRDAIGFCSNLLCKCRLRYSKNGEIKRCKHIKNGQNVRPKNTYKYLLSMDIEVDKSYMCVLDVQK